MIQGEEGGPPSKRLEEVSVREESISREKKAIESLEEWRRFRDLTLPKESD